MHTVYLYVAEFFRLLFAKMFLVVFLADVDVIDLPDSVDGNINMDFVRQMSVLLRELRSYQKTHHKFRKNLPWIYMDTVLKDDEHIEKMAMMCAEGEETNTEYVAF